MCRDGVSYVVFHKKQLTKVQAAKEASDKQLASLKEQVSNSGERMRVCAVSLTFLDFVSCR